YRALGHSFVKDTCTKKKAVLAKFPKEIQDFANVFLQMQIKRDDADYNPQMETAFKSAVLTDISIAEVAIDSDQPPLSGPGGMLVEGWPLRQRGRRSRSA